MATLIQNLQSIARRDGNVHFNLGQFISENVTSSWGLLLWLIVLTYITVTYTLGQLGPATYELPPPGSFKYLVGQFINSPLVSIVILTAWAVSLLWTAVNEITRNHNARTLWLKDNLYSSITNAELSLLISLLLWAGIRAFISWAYVRASFSPDPAVTDATLSQFADPGANWGAVVDNFRNLMVFRFPREQNWRLWFVILWNVLLLIPSSYVFSREVFRRSRIRTILIILWLLTPIFAFFMLLGVVPASNFVVSILLLAAVIAALVGLYYLSRLVTQRLAGGAMRGIATIVIAIVWLAALFGAYQLLRQAFVTTLNPDTAWGGLLLTLILAVFGIVASFPLGLMLALGRRSQIRGIPAWLTYGAAVVLTGYFLVTSTPGNLEAARSFTEQLLAFWPVLILVVAFLFQRYFKGNVVALFSTIYIEVIRGVPLITILFMSIILFPIFLPPGTEILGTWRVMVAVALFAAAYLAENVRGGLQSLNNGQYEAADAISLNTAQKYRLVILPQALRAVIPAIVGQFIGLFKDTTLVAIVGLVELLGVANLISAQPDWLGVRKEPYVFIALIYFIGSAIMAGYSRRLEARLGVGER